MNGIITFSLFLGIAASANGGILTNESSAVFKDTDIVWAASTNDWPTHLWTYKVIPQVFSDAVISNLMAVGSFTSKDRTNISNYIDTKDQVIFYGNLEGTMKHLAICPALGFIEYHDGTAKSASQLKPIAAVPDQDETTRLGLQYLRLIGIDVSQIATKADSCDLDLHWERQTIDYVDQQTKTEVTLTNGYGIFFLRRIDGVNVAGIGLNGGAYLSFGNNGKLADLQMSWRNLKPYELNDCPPPQQITEWLRSGHITLHSLSSAAIDYARIQKLTIIKATPLYTGKHYDEPLDVVSPFARFEAVAEEGTNTASLWFESPLTVDKATRR